MNGIKFIEIVVVKHLGWKDRYGEEEEVSHCIANGIHHSSVQNIILE